MSLLPPSSGELNLFDADVIAYDLTCVECDYNLRGLKRQATCPECGHSVDECLTFAASRVQAGPALPAAANAVMGGPVPLEARAELASIEAAAPALGVPGDAALFIFDVPRFLLFAAHPELAEVGQPLRLHTTAQELCAAFRDYAQIYFGPRARLVLEHWGIRGSDDLGRLLLGLLARGLMDIQGVDFKTDFQGLFTPERLFARAAGPAGERATEEVLVRWPVAADHDDWLRMREALRPECPRAMQLEEMNEYMSSAGRMAVLLAEAGDGKLLGFLEATIRPRADGCDSRDVGYIEGWYVEEAHRRRGVGRQLVEAAEDWARSQGCVEMASDCVLANDVSLRAHLALGYQEEACR